MAKFIGYLFGIIFGLGLSWIATCGMVALIFLCFSLQYTWLIATGIWLCLVLLAGFIRLKISFSVS